LPQPRSSKARAADTRIAAGASAQVMISASAAIAALLRARASAAMSSGISVSSVIMRNEMAVFGGEINPFRPPQCKLQDVLMFCGPMERRTHPSPGKI